MLKEFFKLYRFRKRHNDDIAKMYLQFYRLFIDRISELKKIVLKELKVLDIGSGKNYPLSYLMSMEGCDITALDPQYVDQGFKKYPGILWYNGLRVALKTFFRDIVFLSSERKILDPEKKGPGRIKFIRANAENTPYPDDSFDVIFSYCAFEHITDIAGVLDECSRIIKTDGIIYITIHSFPSLSGGHHPSWFFPDISSPTDIPPWFHLRGGSEKYRKIMDYGLNGLRPEQYREEFRKRTYFKKEFMDRKEGVLFLSEKIRQELCDYSEEELLTAFVTFVAGKKQQKL